MPPVRRRALKRHEQLDCERTRYRLETGHDFLFLDGPELTDGELADAWQALGESITEAYVREHPGTRPWAWWRWDAPEPRQQVADGPEPIGSAVWFGMPACYKGIPAEGMYESEPDYLRRLGLLIEAERAALTTR